jgi:hypothetical protein
MALAARKGSSSWAAAAAAAGALGPVEPATAGGVAAAVHGARVLALAGSLDAAYVVGSRAVRLAGLAAFAPSAAGEGAAGSEGGGAYGACGACEALLLPGLTCRVSTRRATAKRLSRRGQRSGGRAAVEAVCGRCGRHEVLGYGSAPRELRDRRRTEASGIAPPGAGKGRRKGQDKERRKSADKGASAIALASAKALGVLAAARQAKALEQQAPQTLLERLEAGGGRPSAASPPVQPVKRTGAALSSGKAKQAKVSAPPQASPEPSKPSSTLAGFLQALNKRS